MSRPAMRPFYVTPNDVAEYARAIGDLLDDQRLRNDMGRVGRQRVEDLLAWQHQAPRLVGAYRQVLSMREPSATRLFRRRASRRAG